MSAVDPSLTHLAEAYPLAYLWWVAYARYVHLYGANCGRADCPICHHIESINQPLSDTYERT